MKLFLAAILASVATTVAGFSPEDLQARWKFDEPDIAFNASANMFTLDFGNISKANIPHENMQEEFYDVNCKDDGSGFQENVIREYFRSPDGVSLPYMDRDDNDNVKLQFVVNYTKMASDTNIYEVVGNDTSACESGAQYAVNLEAYFNYTEIVDEDSNDITWAFVKNIDNVVVATGSLYDDYDHNFNASSPSDTTTVLLCRGVDYTFKAIDPKNWLKLNFIQIKGWYNSRGTADLIFDSEQVIKKTFSDEGFNATVNFPENPSNPATDISGKDGMGMMKFCVRSVLGYHNTTNPTLHKSLNLTSKIESGFKEVNFIESLITIFFNLEAGINVTSFNVEPKERIETTAAEDQYTLEAWLCPNVTNLKVTTFDNYNEQKAVPYPIELSYLANFTGQKTYFNQGALISVCVAPDDAAWTDGIRMNGITKFDWNRNDLETGEQTALSIPNIEQSAIENGNKATNGLTSYDRTECENGQDFCTFASILFADFYISQGAVSGFGDAKLAFKTSRRRLGDPEGRELQNDPGAASPFDVNVPVDLTDTGPGSLKTAGGSSFGIGTFTFTMALLGAFLLA